MALPQKIIEQLGRSPVRTPGWSGQLLMFSFTLFLVSFSVYIGLVAGYRPYVNSQIKKLDNQIEQLASQVSVEDQANLLKFYGQIINLKTLLDNHAVTSQLFRWFEEHTARNVYYSKFSLNAEKGSAALGGFAKSVEDVSEQLAVFAADKSAVRDVVLGNTTLDKSGLWQFSLTLTVDPKFLKVALPAKPENQTP